MSGTATITATATQFLSRFNLDLDGLKVRSITVNGAPAKWHRSQGELVITPASPLPNVVAFTTVIVYDGIPGPIPDNEFGGWIATDDGVVVAGQPHGAATWFPANDHPIDKASFTFHVSVPDRLQVVANGSLQSMASPCPVGRRANSLARRGHSTPAARRMPRVPAHRPSCPRRSTGSCRPRRIARPR